MPYPNLKHDCDTLKAHEQGNSFSRDIDDMSNEIEEFRRLVDAEKGFFPSVVDPSQQPGKFDTSALSAKSAEGIVAAGKRVTSDIRKLEDHSIFNVKSCSDIITDYWNDAKRATVAAESRLEEIEEIKLRDANQSRADEAAQSQTPSINPAQSYHQAPSSDQAPPTDQTPSANQAPSPNQSSPSTSNASQLRHRTRNPATQKDE